MILAQKKNPRPAAYILPNLITAASLFLGFLAIKLSYEALFHFESLMYFKTAAYCILAAMICDGLDGSVARLTSTQSSFGIQFDSLCDLVSFGVAPACLIYNFSLKSLGNIGLSIAFIYVLCGALRLGRFNIQANKGKASGNFTGIPIPMAAAPICLVILCCIDEWEWVRSHNIPATFLSDSFVKHPSLFGILTFVIALGMVSTFSYVSIKNLKFPKKRPFTFLAFFLVITALIVSFDFLKISSVILVIYCLHGPILSWLEVKYAKKSKVWDDDDEDDYFEPLNENAANKKEDV